jgi:hypothetical protein
MEQKENQKEINLAEWNNPGACPMLSPCVMAFVADFPPFKTISFV